MKFQSTLAQFMLFRKNYDIQYSWWQEAKMHSKDVKTLREDTVGVYPRQTPLAPRSKWQLPSNHRFLCLSLWALGEYSAAA
jgi:hypothetical protein